LAAQLWALKHGGPDIKGLDELQRLAASGRTSFPVAKEVQRAFYRTIGYRVCGERAVRVDILERLADLIRPALSWRPGSAAPQPAGAFEGIGFTVTQAMTSLTGSSGEDFASILRALGYRMERRPKPVKVAAEAETLPPPDAAAPASDQPATTLEPPADTVADPPLAAEGEMATDGAQVDQGPTPHDSTSPGMTLHALGDAEVTATIAGDQGASDPAPSAVDEVAAVAEAGPADAPAAASDGATADPGLPQTPGATAEPELIDVWRPGGRSEERRGQRRPPQWQRARQSPDKAPAANTAEERAIAAADGSEPVVEAGPPIEKRAPRHRGQRSGPPGEFRRERDDGGERRQRDHRAEHRSERQGDRPERTRGERHVAKGRTEHKDRRDYAPLREREKQIDPNSPFAKLAALKAQLEANAKERR
jgi:ATP-dependent RNA helicase SUPV3L1/SUV3